MAKKRDYKLNPPKTLADLNTESMLDFVENNYPEDLAWIVEVFDSNKETKEYKFNSKSGSFKKGDTFEGFDTPAIRKAFAKKYFPFLLEKKKATKKSAPTINDRLDKIRKGLK